MSKCYVFLFMAFILKANSQVSLTIGDVYDYTTGDVFQYYYEEMNTSPTYITDTVTAKNLSGNSVTYQFARYSYKLQTCASCSPTITRSTFSASYTNLSSPFTYTNASSCCTASVSCYHDTLKASGYCGLPSYESAWTGPVDPNTLSPCNMFDLTVTKGMGVTYSHKRAFNVSYDQKNRMIYAKKGTSVCGSYISVGMQEKQPIPAISVYPNPATGMLTIHDEAHAYSNASITIMNYLGETVMTLPYSESVPIYTLAPGCYMLTIKADRGAVYSARFIKAD